MAEGEHFLSEVKRSALLFEAGKSPELFFGGWPSVNDRDVSRQWWRLMENLSLIKKTTTRCNPSATCESQTWIKLLEIKRMVKNDRFFENFHSLPIIEKRGRSQALCA